MSDSLGRGPEMAISVLVFTVIGLIVDSQLGTMPLITIALVVFSVVGNMVRMFYTYDGQMKSLEAQRNSTAFAHQRNGTKNEN